MLVTSDDIQNANIIRISSKDSSKNNRLKPTEVEHFAKSLLNFETKFDNFNRSDLRCQVASLEDLQVGHTLKLYSKKPAGLEKGKVVRIKKCEG